jgi:hypothetical protein
MNPTRQPSDTPTDCESSQPEVVFCRLPAAEKAALKSMAEHRGMTMTAFVSHMLHIFMQARTISERERMRTEKLLRQFDAV